MNYIRIRTKESENRIAAAGNAKAKTQPHQYKLIKTVGGIDWGFSDAGAIVVLGLFNDGHVLILDERKLASVPISSPAIPLGMKMNPAVMAGAGKKKGSSDRDQEFADSWINIGHELKGRYGIEVFYADPEQPEAIQQFNDAGLPTRAADNDRRSGYRQIIELLYTGRMRRAPHCQQLVADFQAGQGHLLDAIRYAVLGLGLVGNTGEQLKSTRARHKVSMDWSRTPA